MFAGDTVTHVGDRYAVDRLFLSPQPVQQPLPIMVGGVGEKKTLRTVARYADIWNAQVDLTGAQHKVDVLERHCADADRDPAEIVYRIDSAPMIRDTEAEARAGAVAASTANGTTPPDPDAALPWVGTVDQVAERIRGYAAFGFTAVTCSLGPPYDEETLTRLIREVKPLAEQS